MRVIKTKKGIYDMHIIFHIHTKSVLNNFVAGSTNSFRAEQREYISFKLSKIVIQVDRKDRM